MLDRLPIGPAPSLLLVLFALSGGWLLLHPIDHATPLGKTPLSVWVFARTHYDAYHDIIPEFEAAHPNVAVDLQLVHARAVTSRLQAAFWADLDVPDLVETEISAVGVFWRGPLDDIGFVDLTDRLHSSGLYDRIVQSRFSPWTTRGHIFGLPHDVHPVMLAYRRDLFEEEGINAADLDTWDKFIQAGRMVTRDHDGDGAADRYMIELSDTNASSFEVLLFQRDGGYFDADGRLIMDNETALQTLLWYVPLVAGPDRIGNSLGDRQILTQQVEAGYLVCFICPDWRTRFFENDIPRVAGKMALMPLPAVKPGGRRTSTWGGTMIGITKKSPNPDLAWALAVHLYYAPKPFDKRFRQTNIIPPIRDAWNQPSLSEPRPYWSNEPIGKLFTALADETPPQYSSPYAPIAKDKLGEVITQCVLYYNEHGHDGFADFARGILKSKADDVRALMRRNPFQ
ncbi:MAG: extracellular solute-binding protein [Phycisphaerae bacterium]|nr:extracellular solute-binding protein [Phycisphaerae bacterium]